jgi:hypothetical protein
MSHTPACDNPKCLQTVPNANPTVLGCGRGVLHCAISALHRSLCSWGAHRPFHVYLEKRKARNSPKASVGPQSLRQGLRYQSPEGTWERVGGRQAHPCPQQPPRLRTPRHEQTLTLRTAKPQPLQAHGRPSLLAPGCQGLGSECCRTGPVHGALGCCTHLALVPRAPTCTGSYSGHM